MIGPVDRQASLLYLALGEQAALIQDDQLGAQATLEHFVPLVQRVVAQTKARVFEGNTRFADKLLS